MKLTKIILSCFALTSSLAFGLDKSGIVEQSVSINGSEVSVKGTGSQSVSIDGANVNIKGMGGQNVKIHGSNVSINSTENQSTSAQSGKVNARHKGGKKARQEDGDSEDK